MASAAEHRENWPLAQHYARRVSQERARRCPCAERLARSKFWQGMNESNQAKLKECYDDLKKAKESDLKNVAKKKYPSEKMLPAAAVIAQYYDMYDQIKNPK